jgi:hypothetical protein
MLKGITKRKFFIRLTNWEFWPFPVLYFPVFFVYVWYALRARSFFFFSTSNPSIEYGGFFLESKNEVGKLMHAKYTPLTIYCKQGVSLSTVLHKIINTGIQYPLILKPDIGAKGVGVIKIENEKQLADIIALYPAPFIIQPYIDYPFEAGIFLVKDIVERTFKITGIVSKEFVTITGDGIHSIRQLLEQNERYILQLNQLKKILADDLHTVLPAGIKKMLVPFGNHARGAEFTDTSHLASKKLESTFNIICSEIQGFNFGRMDIKYSSWEELENGLNFSIIELNGAGSEPAHIYDTSHSVFFAWKEISRHFKLLFEVSMHNHQHLQIPYLTFSDGLKFLKKYFLYQKVNKQLLQNVEYARIKSL